MWDLSSPTIDQTHTLCVGKQSLNHWTSREIPLLTYLVSSLSCFQCSLGHSSTFFSLAENTSHSVAAIFPPPFLKFCFSEDPPFSEEPPSGHPPTSFPTSFSDPFLGEHQCIFAKAFSGPPVSLLGIQVSLSTCVTCFIT